MCSNVFFHNICIMDWHADVEKKLIKEFYKETMNETDLVPKPGKPSFVVHRKVIAVFVPEPNMISRTASKKTNLLPPVTEIGLYHIGQAGKNNIKYGYREDKRQFFYPATDLGGLTNFRQSLGSKPKFVGNHYHAEVATVTRVYNEWLRLSGKTRFTGIGLRKSVDKWMRSCKEFAGKNKMYDYMFRFVRLPDMHRVLVAPEDVERVLGFYPIRLFGKKKPYRTRTRKDGEVFSAVTEMYVNTDINMNNIKNEYITYENTSFRKVPKRDV